MNPSEKLIKALCEAYQVGDLQGEPLPLMGGALHSTWKIKTSTGLYVIKKINPALVQKKNQFRLSEKIAGILAQSITAIPAICQNDDVVFSFEDDLFLLFPYKNASIISQNEVRAFHVEKIATALAEIHQADVSLENPPEVDIFQRGISYWRESLQGLILSESKIEILEKIHAQYLNFIPMLKNNLIISHRDLDPKNVLWNQVHYYIIDWESAGLINKTKDVLATALYWSFDPPHKINFDYMKLFLKIYEKIAGKINHNEITAGIYGLIGDWLSWLDFNIQRIGNFPPETSEHQIGIQQVQNTLNALPILYEQITEIIELENFCQPIAPVLR